MRASAWCATLIRRRSWPRRRSSSRRCCRSCPDPAPDRHDLAHGRPVVADAAVEGVQIEVVIAVGVLFDLPDERVEAPTLLVDLDDVAGSDALRGPAL